MCRFRLRDSDGHLATPNDWLIDVSNWAVRYLKAQSGVWPLRRSTFLPPQAISEIDERVSVAYLSVNFKGAAHVAPFGSSSAEWMLRACRSHPPTDSIRGEASANPVHFATQSPRLAVTHTHVAQWRSWRAILGRSIEAVDGKMGHVIDILAESGDWTVSFLLMRLRCRWRDRKLLVPVEWVSEISSSDTLVRLNVGVHVVSDAPSFKYSRLSCPEYQEELLESYRGSEITT